MTDLAAPSYPGLKEKAVEGPFFEKFETRAGWYAADGHHPRNGRNVVARARRFLDELCQVL